MLPVPIISLTLSWHHDPQDHTRLRVGRMRPHLTSLPPFASDCAVSVEKERFWGDIMLGKVPLLESCVNGLMLLSILECRRKVILCSFYLLEHIDPKKKLSDIEVLNQVVLALSKIELFIISVNLFFTPMKIEAHKRKAMRDRKKNQAVELLP